MDDGIRDGRAAVEIHLDGIAASLPARFSFLVEGPDEAAVLGRLAAAGDRSVPLADLVAAVTVRGVPRQDAVTTVRAVLARLEAAAAAERIGGGFRLVDPGVAPATGADRSFVLPATAAGSTAPPPVAPTAGSDVTAYLQRLTLPKGVTSVATGTVGSVPALGLTPVTGAMSVEQALTTLVGAGWVGVPVDGARLLTSPGATEPPALLLLVGTAPDLPASLPLQLAGRAPGPTALVILPDPGPAPPAGIADRLVALGGDPRIVADAPALPVARDVVARTGGGRFVFDVRGAVLPMSLPPAAEAADAGAGAPRPVPADPAAAAVAGAMGVETPAAQRRRRRGRAGAIADGFAAVLGPRLADLLAGVQGQVDDADEDEDRGADGHRGGGADRREPPPGLLLVDDQDAAAVAGALAAGDVEVRVMGDDERALEEVVAWLDDGEGEWLLAPLT